MKYKRPCFVGSLSPRHGASSVGPCHHGIARPQVVDGGTVSDMEGSCEYIEYAVADSRRGVVFQLGGWARC
jgi:hypothetical protein